MRTSLLTRIASSFGSLFVAAIASLLGLWYFGFPPWGLMGASDMQLAQAIRALEQGADHQRDIINIAISERRGDALVVAENRVLSQQLQNKDPRLVQDFERVTHRLQRAYPDRYLDVLIVDPTHSVILASTQSASIGQPFSNPQLIARARMPGIKEMVIQVESAHGTTLAIVRQILAPDAEGYPNRDAVGILIAYISPHMWFPSAILTDPAQRPAAGSSYLLDAQGRPLSVQSTGQPVDVPALSRYAPPVANGFEGALQTHDAQGHPTLVVYRHIRLSGEEGWTLVHHMARADALAALQGSIGTLLLAGGAMMLLALGLIAVMAYRLTLPLRALAHTAQQLGTGELTARMQLTGKEAREVETLASTFNHMADNIERGHRQLESAVLERTLELAEERDRAQRYLDIAAVMLLALNADGRIAMINAAGAQLLGLSEEALIGMDWFEHFIPTAQRNSTKQVFLSMMRGEIEAFKHRENDIVTASGATRTLTWQNALLHDGTGKVTGTLSSAQDITERKAAEQEIRSLAFFDPLTGLPNRRLLIDRLGHAMGSVMRQRKLGALLFIDLDHFKTINDTLGHDKGDQLLTIVAQRLRSCVRTADTVARFGGDEFVVLLENLSENLLEATAQARAVGEKMLVTLNQSYDIAGHTLYSTPSIGITVLGEHTETIEEPLKRADIAMYQAKAAGRNTVRFFTACPI